MNVSSVSGIAREVASKIATNEMLVPTPTTKVAENGRQMMQEMMHAIGVQNKVIALMNTEANYNIQEPFGELAEMRAKLAKRFLAMFSSASKDGILKSNFTFDDMISVLQVANSKASVNAANEMLDRYTCGEDITIYDIFRKMQPENEPTICIFDFELPPIEPSITP